MHRSGTAGRDLTCCGVEVPSRPASRYCNGRLAGVTRRGITTGEIASRVSNSYIGKSDPSPKCDHAYSHTEINMSRIRVAVIIHYVCHKLIAFSRFPY